MYWSPFGEAYVTPVEPDLVGVAILSSGRPDLAWFPRLTRQLRDAATEPGPRLWPTAASGFGRVAGRVLLVGDAAGYEDALTGEGVSLAVKQARAAVAAIVAGDPSSDEGELAPNHPRLPDTHPRPGAGHRDARRTTRRRPRVGDVARRVQESGEHVGALVLRS